MRCDHYSFIILSSVFGAIYHWLFIFFSLHLKRKQICWRFICFRILYVSFCMWERKSHQSIATVICFCLTVEIDWMDEQNGCDGRWTLLNDTISHPFFDAIEFFLCLRFLWLILRVFISKNKETKQQNKKRSKGDERRIRFISIRYCDTFSESHSFVCVWDLEWNCALLVHRHVWFLFLFVLFWCLHHTWHFKEQPLLLAAKKSVYFPIFFLLFFG